MDQLLAVVGLVMLAATAYWLGLRAQKREAVKPPPHRAVVVGVEGFCRLIRGWEWVQQDEGGGTVGVTLRGVGGTTGMHLALVQVEREMAAGNVLPIRLDRVSGLVPRIVDEVMSAATWNTHVRDNLRIANDLTDASPAAVAHIDPWRKDDVIEQILDDPAGAAREGITLGDQAEPGTAQA